MSEVTKGANAARKPPEWAQGLKIPDEMTGIELREAREMFEQRMGISYGKPDAMGEKEYEAAKRKVHEEIEEHVLRCAGADWQMKNARSLLCMANPEMTASILRVEWFVDPYELGTYAYATGSQIAVGGEFARISDNEGRVDTAKQMGVLAHEMMHVAMDHPARTAQFMSKHEKVPHFLLNICADAIINEGLVKNKFVLPDGIMWRDYVALAPPDDPIHTKRHAGGEVFEVLALKAAEWIEEELENEDSAAPASGEGGTRGSPGTGSEAHPRRGGAGKDDETTAVGQDPTNAMRPEPTGSGSMRDRIEERARKKLAENRRELSGLKNNQEGDIRTRRASRTEDAHKTREIVRAFNESTQLQNAGGRNQGSGLGTTLRELNEIDAPPVDWRRELDRNARKAFGAKMKRNPLIPSRDTLIRMARVKTKAGCIFTPKRVRQRKPGTLHLGMDTSGSIDDPKLEAYLAHGARVACQHGAKILFTLSDDDIREAIEIDTCGRNAVSICKEFLKVARNTEGGGGTSFVPVTQIAREKKVDATFFYTDLMGDFDPKPPPGLMVWCVYKSDLEHTRENPPYGRVLSLSY